MLCGTAGSVLAAELSAARAQVLVIESGGPDDAPTIANPSLWFYNVGGYELTARLEPDFDLRPGDRAEFKLDLTNLVLFDPSTEKLIA